MPGDAILLDTLFANAPFGLAFWDTELRFGRINEALATMNGVPIADHLGRTVGEVLPDLGGGIQERLERVLSTGRAILDVEVAGETPAGPGERRHWRASYFPVLGTDGRALGVAAVVTDITAERRAQDERTALARDAVTARALAQAARVRAESAQEEAEEARAEAERARRRTEFLASATARMIASMDYETTLGEVVRAAVPAIADWCALTVLEPDGRFATLAVAHADPAREALAWELMQRYPPTVGDAVGIPYVVRTGRADVMDPISDDVLVSVARDEQHLDLLRRLGIGATAIVPLQTPERLIGAFALATEHGRRLTAGDVAVAEALASRAALAIENARLYTERSHIAHTLQASLLPRRLPEIPGVDVAAHYRAAGDENEVGGDFYDVFASGEGVWTALVGDVSGKGAEAAALTSLTRHTLRAAALLDGEPADNLRLLNRAFLAQADADHRFCTVIYARVMPNAEGGARLSLSSGGHLPPVVLHADGTVEEVVIPGTLVGALRQPRFGEIELHLAAGDLLLLYTDGVVELRGQDSFAGEHRLHEELARHARAPASVVTEAIARMAVDAQDGAPRDDIAIVALRALPGA